MTAEICALSFSIIGLVISWLSDTERHIADKILVDGIGATDVKKEDEGMFDGLKSALKDPQVWLSRYDSFPSGS